jgi:GntR family transcriptional regulator/MocR family aminotransferase
MLATDLGVSRRLVVDAYEQLLAEGYVITDQRSTTRVAEVSSATAFVAADELPAPRFDLRPGTPALGEFPRSAWLKAVASVLRDTPDGWLGYPDPRGAAALRNAVAAYVRRVRAAAAEPDRVVVCAGFRQALSLLTRALDRPLVALEDPGLVGSARTVAVAGGSLMTLPVDKLGARTDLLHNGQAQMAVVTPAHQFPVGVTLAPERRAHVLSWARNGHLVVEDDYDAEFRYDRQLVGALQGLAPDHVAYVGTASKTLAPGLRLAWMVVPSAILADVIDVKQSHDGGSPILEQLTFAHLLESGVYERNLRRMRRHYRQRRDTLLDALHRWLPVASVSGTAAGLHLVLRLPDAIPASTVVETAARHGLALTAVQRYVLLDGTARDDCLVLGFGNIATSAIDVAVRRLADAVSTVRG